MHATGTATVPTNRPTNVAVMLSSGNYLFLELSRIAVRWLNEVKSELSFIESHRALTKNEDKIEDDMYGRDSSLSIEEVSTLLCDHPSLTDNSLGSRLIH